MDTSSQTIMSGKMEERAQSLLNRTRSGERTRELVEELDQISSLGSEQASEDAFLGLMEILADQPSLFIQDQSGYENLFSDLESVDPDRRNGAAITFHWLSQNPPEELATTRNLEYIVSLCGHDDPLIEKSAYAALANLAQDHPNLVRRVRTMLSHSLTNRSPGVRAYACIALGRIGYEGAQERIKALEEASIPHLSQIARRVLDKLDCETRGARRWQIKDLLDYEPREFESLIAELWEEMGYETEVTPKIKDGGYDVDAHSEGERILIEAKRYTNNPVGSPEVQQLTGVVANRENADRGVLVTSSTFTKPALSEVAESDKIILTDGEDFCTLLTEYDVPKYV